MPKKHFAIVEKYCLDCHDSATAKGEFDIENLSFEISKDVQTADHWQKVLNALNSGEMPPEKKPQLTAEEKSGFLEDLSLQMVTARNALSDSGGQIPLRRLNRREYANTIESLLGVRPDVSNLPDDQASVAGFDTAGASLFMSSDQIEQHLETARGALRLAIVAKPQRPSETIRIEPEDTYLPKYSMLAVERLDTAKRYYNWRAAGGTDEIAKEYGFLDGWQADRNLNNFKESYPPLEKWLSAPENRTGAAMMITIKEGFTPMVLPRLREWQPGAYIIRIRAAAYQEDPVRFRYLEFVRKEGQSVTGLGWRKVSALLHKPEIIEFTFDHAPGLDANYQIQKRSHMDRGDKNLEAEYRKENRYGTPWGVWVDWFELEGPLPTEPTKFIASILGVRAESQTEDEHARQVLEGFAERAFRGAALDPGYRDQLVARYQGQRAKGLIFAEALIEPMAIVLSSPSFLYMVEPSHGDSPQKLSDRELAVRLSYFLWSEPPDEELSRLAKNGELADAGVLRQQTARLLADARADRFVRGFVHQWLELERLDMFQFDGRQFPTFDNAVRANAREEVFQWVHQLMQERLPLRLLLKSDFAIVNDLMADYYGIPGVAGHEFRRVPVKGDSLRGGLLGTAAILAMGSDGQRSSPVERGAWVLRKLLNNPPPPAPPNVPMLSRFDGTPLGARELAKAHQEEPQCAQCHQKIDPVGLGLENFDAAGLWREVETVSLGEGRKAKHTEFAIDPSGQLPGGKKFADFLGLRDAVATSGADFEAGFTEALIAYALGRPFGFSDQLLAEDILRQARSKGGDMSQFIHALIQSKTFQTK